MAVVEIVAVDQVGARRFPAGTRATSDRDLPASGKPSQRAFGAARSSGFRCGSLSSGRSDQDVKGFFGGAASSFGVGDFGDSMRLLAVPNNSSKNWKNAIC